MFVTAKQGALLGCIRFTEGRRLNLEVKKGSIVAFIDIDLHDFVDLDEPIKYYRVHDMFNKLDVRDL